MQRFYPLLQKAEQLDMFDDVQHAISDIVTFLLNLLQLLIKVFMNERRTEQIIPFHQKLFVTISYWFTRDV